MYCSLLFGLNRFLEDRFDIRLIELLQITPGAFRTIRQMGQPVRHVENLLGIDAELPRVLDGFQTFLRELRPEDLEGSAGMARVKEELLRRITLAIQPPIVSDILFKEVIVQ